MSGLGLGIDLSLRCGLRRGTTAAAPFTPAALFAGGASGIWYDPSDLASMSQDAEGTVPAAIGQPVGIIRDKSGNVHDAVQPDPVKRPLLILDEAGKPCLAGDGADDWLSAAFAINQPWVRVSAIRQDGWSADRRIFASTTGSTGLLYQRGAAPTLAVHFGGSSPTSAALQLGAAGVVTERHWGAASRLAVGSGPYANGSASTTVNNGIAIFAGAAGALASAARCYGVVVIGRDLTDEEVDRARAFLAAKAGIAL